VLQGLGLGVAPLVMASARDHLPPQRLAAAVALLSVTAVAGIGFGYPLNGVVTEHFGIRAGFWLGATVTCAALVLAALVVPASTAPRAPRLDLRGALLLCSGAAGLLLAVAQGDAWGWTSPLLMGILSTAVVLLAAWVIAELRTDHPLVDLRLARHRTVLAANVTGLLAGIGMYLLLALVARYVQTPVDLGYGFGGSVVVAGMALVPFSVGSLVASRLAGLLSRRVPTELLLPVGCLIFVVGFGMFLLARATLWQVLVCMGLAGLGVGLTFAAMPGLIVRSVPAGETGSAISFNMVVRLFGYAVGSALCAAVLDGYTQPGATYPADAGYDAAAVVGLVLWSGSTVLCFLLVRTGSGRGRPVRGGPGAPRPGDERLRAGISVAAGVTGSSWADLTRPDPTERRP
jgi:MFS family permease